jgi:hypothetical protein
MTQYAWEVTFRFPDPFHLANEEDTLRRRSSDGHAEYVLGATAGNRPMHSAAHLTLYCGGFTTDEDAKQAGRRAVDAIMLAGATLRLGTATSGPKVVRIGLVTLAGPSVSGTLCVTTPAQRFMEAFDSAFASSIDLTDDHRLALELFSLSQFEEYGRSRLLTLISAVEVLARQQPSPDSVVAVVSELLVRVQASDLCSAQKCALSSRLGGLKRESIGEATRRFVAASIPRGSLYNGKAGGDFIKDCYELRSDFSHGRRRPDEREVTQAVSDLQRLVPDLLLAVTGFGHMLRSDQCPSAQDAEASSQPEHQ